MNDSSRIELEPFSNSSEYQATEIYRGVQIRVAYCYLRNPASSESREKTLGWRYSLPDAVYWMYKFATPEEAFLKARETVDLRIRQGTVPSTDGRDPRPPNSEGKAMFSAEAIVNPARVGNRWIKAILLGNHHSWNNRASWGLALAILGSVFSLVEFFEAHRQATFFWAIILLTQTLISWGGVYGLFSFLLWPFRCITLNRSKKPLWNTRATCAVLVAFLTIGIFTNHRYWAAESGEEESKVLAEGIVGLPSTICVFYGLFTGLTFLWKSIRRVP